MSVQRSQYCGRFLPCSYTISKCVHVQLSRRSSKLFADAGLICIASLISPYRSERSACRKLLHNSTFIEVYFHTLYRIPSNHLVNLVIKVTGIEKCIFCRCFWMSHLKFVKLGIQKVCTSLPAQEKSKVKEPTDHHLYYVLQILLCKIIRRVYWN